MNFATPTTPLDDAKGSRNKKLLKDAGAMTSEQIRKKFNLPAYDSSHCEIDGKTDFDLLGKYHDECSKLLNDAIKRLKKVNEGIEIHFAKVNFHIKEFQKVYILENCKLCFYSPFHLQTQNGKEVKK